MTRNLRALALVTLLAFISTFSSAQITPTGTPAALLTSYGTPSATTTFDIQATGLTGNLALKPPVGFEISLSPSSGFGGSAMTLTITPVAGDVSTTTIYVRLAATAGVSATYSGDIVATDDAAMTANIATTTSEVTAAPLTITADNANKAYGILLSATGSSSAFTAIGLQNGETVGTVALAYNAGAVATESVRTYGLAIIPSALTGGTFTASNYNLTYVNGDLTVTAVALSITASNTTKIYGATLTGGTTTVAFTASGLKNSDAIDNVTLAYSGGDAATADAGSYTGTITASAATGAAFSATNYTITYNPGNVTVTPAALTVSAHPVTKAFGTSVTGGAGSSAFTPTGLQNGDAIGGVTILYPAGSAATASVRTYGSAVVASLATGGTFTPTNYTINYVPANLTVTAVALTITASNTTKVYGAVLTNGNSAAFTVTGLVNSDAITAVALTYSAGFTGTANVATYTGAITALAATTGVFSPTNYSITYNAGDVDVTAAALSITASNTTKIYGTTLTAGAGSSAFTSTGLKNGETITSVTLAYSSGDAATANVGSYTSVITPSLPVGGGTFNVLNYSITFNTGNVTVNTAPLTIKATDVTKVFGTGITGGTGSSAFTSTALANGETISTVTISYTAGFTATDNVGVYPTAVTATAATGGGFTPGNYTITYNTGSITVTRAPLTITATPVSKVYGVTLSTVVGSAAFSATGLVNADAITGVTITYVSGGAATAGVLTYTGSVTPSAPTGTALISNYTITFVSTALNVVAKPLTITGSLTKPYGAAFTNSLSTGGFITTALANSETISSVFSTFTGGNAATDAVGTYTSTVTPSGAVGGTFTAANYSIAYVTGNVVVTAVTITIIPTPITKPYGVTVSASGTFTQFTVTNIKNAETIGSVNATFGAGAPAVAVVGTYTGTITLSAATGGTFSAGNYNIVYNTGPITIVPAALTLTANDVTKSYGTLITGTAGSGAFTVTALANGEVITGVTTAYGTGSAVTGTVGTHAGAVTLSQPTGTATVSNYSITYVPGNIIVTAVPLTITANPVTKTYGTVNSTGSSAAFTSTGLKNGETIGSVTLTYGPGGAGTAAVGSSYTSDIVPSTATAGTFTTTNYNITYVPAGITITTAPLTITANDVVKTFGITLTSGSGYTNFASSGLQNSETIGSVTVAYGAGASSTATAGTYPASIAVSSPVTGTFTASNYSIAYVTGSILIGDPTLSASASIAAMTSTYGTSSAGVSFAVSGTNISGGILVTPPTGYEVSTTSSTAGFAPTVTVGSTGNIGATTVYIRIKATTFAGTYTGTVTVSTAGIGSITITTSGTVSAAGLTIAASNATREYGTVLLGGSGSTAFAATGLKNGETIGSIVVTYSSTGNSTFDAVGTYVSAITPSFPFSGTFTAANYSISYTNGNIIVVSSTNAKLSALATSSGTLSPAFAGATEAYSLTVGNLVTSITLTPTVDIPASTVKVNGVTVTSGTSSAAITLTTGNNTVTVVGTAQNGTTTKTYTITVFRERSTNANLSALGSSIAFTPAFATGTLLYTLSVANAVTSITLTPTVADATATIKVNDVAVSSGASSTINLGVGTNAITVRVTAEDGTTTKLYSVTVTRAPSTNANLSALASSVAFTPAFASGTLAYSLSVANSVSSISFTPTTAETTAVVTINGITTITGTSRTVSLAVGSNTITTRVTAQDGVTTQSYVLTVTRAGSSNATLSALVISAGTLGPVFASSTVEYKVSVANAITSITLTPTLAEVSASVKVNGTSVTSGTSTAAIALSTGTNTISIVVTAQDGTTNTYTLTVSRDAIALSSNAGLSALAVSTGALAPAFATATTAYTVTLVTDAVTSITLTPTAAEVSTVITVNGVSATSGTAITVSVPDDLTIITIKMVASDGTIKTYTVTVAKPKTTWKGAITGGSWTDAANWTNGVPDATKLAVIGATNISPVITGTVTVGSMNIGVGVVINITGNLQVTGNVVNAGTFSGTGVVTCTGSATQTFSGTGNINNLTINNPTRVSIAPGSGNTMSLAGVLTVSQGVFSTGNNLILLSTATQTASVAALPSSTSIDGQVTVQRWISGQRGYRIFGHPFNGALPLSQLTDNFAISGSGAGFASGLGYTHASVSYFDSLSSGGGQQKALSDAPNTAGTLLWSVSRGILALYRGKGIEGLSGYISGVPPTASAADVTGSLNQGALADYVLGANATGTSFNMVGNPYAAPINIKLLKSNGGLLSANPAISNTISIYNPFKNAGVSATPGQEVRGGWDTYTNDGSTDIIIPSMGGFAIQAKSTGNVLKFDESVKAVGSTPLTLMGAGDQKVSKLTLQVENSRGSWDDLKLRWENTGTALGTDSYDGIKLNNELFDLYSIATDNTQLTIDSRSNSFSTDQVIPLGIRTSVVDKTFRFKVSNYDMPSDVTVYLHDKLLNKEEPLRATGDTYAFELTADTATGGNNRFELLIKATQKTVTPVTGDVASEEEVRFMPNPFKETLSIKLGGNMVSSTSVTRVRLLDMNGRPVKLASYAPNTSQIQMNTADISVGIYLVEISNDKNTVIKKAIKQ